MELKKQFCKKLYEELTSFQKEMTGKRKDDSTGSFFKNEIFISLYCILLEGVDELSDVLLENLVNQGISVIESLYQHFTKESADGVIYDDLKHYVQKELNEYEETGDCWWEDVMYGEEEHYE